MSEKRTAIVTGAARGIGKAVVGKLLSRGHTVAGFDVDEQALQEMVPEMSHLGVFIPATVDVSSEADIEASVQSLQEQFGPITIVVNNVGGSMGISQAIENVTSDEWDSIIELNLKSTFLVTRKVVPLMKEAQWGRIVNMTSIAGRGRSYFGGTPYAAAKAGIIGFTRQGSRELGAHGITINAVAPGVVMSGERIERYWHDRKSEEERQGFLRLVPLGRLGTNEEIAAVVDFLCSEESSYITGAVIDANGGFWVG